MLSVLINGGNMRNLRSYGSKSVLKLAIVATTILLSVPNIGLTRTLAETKKSDEDNARGGLAGISTVMPSETKKAEDEHNSDDDEVTKSKSKKGYTVERVNVRKEPNTDSKVLTVLDINTKIEYYNYSNKWLQIEYKGKTAYIYSKYVSNKKINYVDYSVPTYSGFKSYEPYTALSSRNSKQYRLQQMATTGKHGIRMINNRYIVAIGTGCTKAEIGSYGELILKNGEVIPIVVGDFKMACHTDSVTHLITCVNSSRCASEFIVATSLLDSQAKRMGNISYVQGENWDSPVKTIRIFTGNNAFND